MDCLHCQQPIKLGRADRKFCSHGCKNEYHNTEKMREYRETRDIVLRLIRNRLILEGLLSKQQELVMAKEVLGKYGFDFDFHTHRCVSSQRNTFILCFNFGFREMDGQRLKIVRWDT